MKWKSLTLLDLIEISCNIGLIAYFTTGNSGSGSNSAIPKNTIQSKYLMCCTLRKTFTAQENLITYMYYSKDYSRRIEIDCHLLKRRVMFPNFPATVIFRNESNGTVNIKYT